MRIFFQIKDEKFSEIIAFGRFSGNVQKKVKRIFSLIGISKICKNRAFKSKMRSRRFIVLGVGRRMRAKAGTKTRLDMLYMYYL